MRSKLELKNSMQMERLIKQLTDLNVKERIMNVSAIEKIIDLLFKNELWVEVSSLDGFGYITNDNKDKLVNELLNNKDTANHITQVRVYKEENGESEMGWFNLDLNDCNDPLGYYTLGLKGIFSQLNVNGE